MHSLEWKHPNSGKVREVLCQKHESEVIRALRTLGMGCAGSSTPERSCTRCSEDPATPPRVFLRRKVGE